MLVARLKDAWPSWKPGEPYLHADSIEVRGAA